jgi:hypothetical protein
VFLLALMAAASATAGCVYHHEIKQTPEQREPHPASLDHRLAALPEARS